MIYVALMTLRPHLTYEQRMAGFARRAEWKYPPGMKLIGEYWPASAPHVVSIVETDSYESIMGVLVTWGDMFEIQVSPATTPEAGLAAGAKLAQKK